MREWLCERVKKWRHNYVWRQVWHCEWHFAHFCTYAGWRWWRRDYQQWGDFACTRQRTGWLRMTLNAQNSADLAQGETR